jgi:radical SAM protein with 4Fe4S-binding SPASM domain
MRAKFDFIKKAVDVESMPKSKYDVITVLFITTNKCSHECVFCIEDSPNRDLKELNTEEFLRTIDQISELGTREIIFSGGEPLLRDDFKQIIKRAKDNGMRAIICTNGYYIDEEMAEFFEDVKLDAIQISVNALGEELYNKLCNPPEDGYRKMLESIDLVRRKYSGRIILSAVPLKTNRHVLKDMLRLCKEKKCERFALFKPAMVGRADKNKGMILTEEEYIEVLDELIQEFKKLGGLEVFIEQPYAKFSSFAERYRDLLKFRYYCTAGTHYFSVTSDGFIVPCASMSHMKEFYMGNVRQESLRQIWENDERWKVFRTDKECKDCEYFKECKGGCKLMSYLATGNVLAKDPLCKFWIGDPSKT